MSGDYAIGLLTIITGLAIADVVTSLHSLLIERKSVRWDWLTLLATLFVIILIIAIWSISYRHMGGRQFNPKMWEFGVILAQVVPMYLASRAILPNAVPDGATVSLPDHYARVSRYFWGSIATTYIAFLGFLFWIEGADGFARAIVSAGIQLTIMTVLVLSRKRSVHTLLVPLAFALLCYNQLNRPMFA